MVHGFQRALGYAIMAFFGRFFIESAEDMLQALLLVKDHDFLENIDDALEVGHCDFQLAVLQKLEIFLAHLIVELSKGKVLVAFVDRLFVLDEVRGLLIAELVVQIGFKLAVAHRLLGRSFWLQSGQPTWFDEYLSIHRMGSSRA